MCTLERYACYAWQMKCRRGATRARASFLRLMRVTRSQGGFAALLRNSIHYFKA